MLCRYVCIEERLFLLVWFVIRFVFFNEGVDVVLADAPREITDVIPLLFLQCGAILISENAPIIKITLWGLSTPQKCTMVRCNLPPKKMHFRQCRGFICNKYPTSLSPKSSHTSRQIGILHYSIKVFVGYWDILHYYPSHRKLKEKKHHEFTRWCFFSFNLPHPPQAVGGVGAKRRNPGERDAPHFQEQILGER